MQNTVRGSRFTQNFKKGFASQEYRGLLSRTEAPLGGLPEAVCLVAVSPDSDEVVGTLDLRPPACAGGRHPKGVPKVRLEAPLLMLTEHCSTLLLRCLPARCHSSQLPHAVCIAELAAVGSLVTIPMVCSAVEAADRLSEANGTHSGVIAAARAFDRG